MGIPFAGGSNRKDRMSPYISGKKSYPTKNLYINERRFEPQPDVFDPELLSLNAVKNYHQKLQSLNGSGNSNILRNQGAIMMTPKTYLPAIENSRKHNVSLT